ncbi:MAG: M48 family metalloprotease [Proteobacteria bacterium]|nr:M48 family metalloprotease [Pseudomonadota bacterium]
MRRLCLFALTALMLVTATVFADESNRPIILGPPAGSDLPELGSPAATLLSQSDEYRLGAMVAHELREQNALLEDPEVSEYLNDLGDRLAAQSPSGGAHFQFFLIKDPTINAFAVPGGYIFIHQGLILVGNSESELAGVMAHEIAHVTQHHIARQLRAQSQQSLTTAAMMIAAILLGAASGGQAAEAGLIGAQGIAAQQQINFTRENEIEADRVGIGFLAAAGFDPNAMASSFETMSRHEGLAATYIPAMLIDHPVTTDRIAEARARAAQFPPRRNKDSESYEMIRERVRVLTAERDVDLVNYYQKKIDRGEATLGDRYGQALALIERDGVDHSSADDAARILDKLVKEHEGNILLHIALAQAQIKDNQAKKGMATFAQAAKLFPRNVPVTVRYAEALMQEGHPMDAHNMLLDLFNIVPPTPQQIRLTALAASAAGDAGDAYFYMGEYDIAGGDLNMAAQQLQLALASPHISSIQRQRYQARLDEVRDYLMSIRKKQLADSGDGQGGQQGQGRGGH